MLSEKDRAVVCNYICTGSLETLRLSFKQFSAEDIEKLCKSECGAKYEEIERIRGWRPEQQMWDLKKNFG